MGTLFWITGLSGAGKTTVAVELNRIVKEKGKIAIFLDGDILREVFAEGHSYTQEDRLKLASQYARLCKMLTNQGINVICATISMFKEVHQWNRANITHYNEIYLKVPMDVLKKRDSKKIYSRAAKGEITQVMGVNIPFEEPEQPDLIINNDGKQKPSAIALKIYEYFSR